MLRLRNSARKTGIVLSLAGLALGVVGVGSAAAAKEHWYVGGSKLAGGTKVNVRWHYENPGKTAKFLMDYYLQRGEHHREAVNQFSGKGVIENPTNGTSALVSEVNLSLSNETGCKIYVTANRLSGYAREFEGKPALTLDPYLEEPHFSSYFEPCRLPRWLNGELTAFVTESSSLELTPSSTEHLVIAQGDGEVDSPFLLTGSAALETTSGQAVTLAP